MGRVTAPDTRFTVDEFFRLVEADVFRTNRVELLNGRIRWRSAPSTAHMSAVTLGFVQLQQIATPRDWVVVGGTLRLDRFSAPDPDLMLIPVPRGTPEHLWPLPAALIEISDSTYKRDSGIKVQKYAQAGVTDYWIENLKADRIEVYRDPKNPSGKLKDCHYASVTRYARGQAIDLLNRPGATIAVDELLP